MTFTIIFYGKDLIIIYYVAQIMLKIVWYVFLLRLDIHWNQKTYQE
jgi:hypothetical protein